eukprot:965984-Pyramimonas_sp.AAC.2
MGWFVRNMPKSILKAICNRSPPPRIRTQKVTTPTARPALLSVTTCRPCPCSLRGRGLAQERKGE